MTFILAIYEHCQTTGWNCGALIVITAGTGCVGAEPTGSSCRNSGRPGSPESNCCRTAAANRQAADERTSLDALSAFRLLWPNRCPPCRRRREFRRRLNALAWTPITQGYSKPETQCASVRKLEGPPRRAPCREWAVRRFAVVTMGQWMDEWANKTANSSSLLRVRKTSMNEFAVCSEKRNTLLRSLREDAALACAVYGACGTTSDD